MGEYTVKFDGDGAIRQTRAMGRRFRAERALLWKVVDGDGRVVSSWNTEREARERAAYENEEHRLVERDARLHALRDQIVDHLQGLDPDDLDQGESDLVQIALILGLECGDTVSRESRL